MSFCRRLRCKTYSKLTDTEGLQPSHVVSFVVIIVNIVRTRLRVHDDDRSNPCFPAICGTSRIARALSETSLDVELNDTVDQSPWHPLVFYNALPVERVFSDALGALDRCRQRNEGHHNEKRDQLRSSFTVNVAVVVSIPEEAGVFDFATTLCCFTRALDLSQGGLAFLCGHEISPSPDSESHFSTVRTDSVLRTGNDLILGLRGGSETVWMRSSTRRVRAVHEQVLEIGTMFQRRLPSEEVEADQHLLAIDRYWDA
jgi:hypothetical protein